MKRVEKDPLFSILIPNFNMGGLLKSAVESALSQTFDSFEVLVLDNASTDDSWEVVNAFNDIRLSKFRQVSNLGMYNNLNVAFMLARGSYSIVLCADDLLHPNCLEILEGVISKVRVGTDLPLFLSFRKSVMATDEIEKNWDSWSSKKHSASYEDYSLLEKLCAGLPNICVSTNAFREFGAFGQANPKIDFSRDVLRHVEFSAQCYRVEVDSELVIERSHPDQNRRIMPKRWQLNEFYEMYVKIGLVDNECARKKLSFLAGQHLMTAVKSIYSDWTLVPLLHVAIFSIKKNLIGLDFLRGGLSKVKSRFLQSTVADG